LLVNCASEKAEILVLQPVRPEIRR
jgi:hypothetical protein